MKTLVIYDSLYGNTKDIAESIYKGITEVDKAIIPVEKAYTDKLRGVQLLIVGSPTHGGTAKPSILEFINRIPKNYLTGMKITTFDTRIDESRVETPLRILMKIIGYAAPKIAKKLQSKGGELITKPEGFIVKDREGPLLTGELERAEKWGKEIISNIS